MADCFDIGEVTVAAQLMLGSAGRFSPFLPFADDDPKTAEVVSKTILLAKDDEIRDPTILDQIVR